MTPEQKARLAQLRLTRNAADAAELAKLEQLELVEAAVTEGVRAATEPMKRELDETKKKLAALEQAPVTDNARSLVGLVAGTKAVRDAKDRDSRTAARRDLRDRVLDVRLVETDKHEGRGIMAARYLRAGMIAQMDRRSIIDVPLIIEKDLGDKALAEVARAHIGEGSRAMSAGVFADGGALIPDILAEEIIELLRPESVVGQLGPRYLDMPQGNMGMSRIDGGVSASYTGELVATSPQKLTSGQIRLVAKKLVALVAESNDLIRFGGARADVSIRNDIVAAIAQARDTSAIRGTGTQYAPAGVKNLMVAGNQVDCSSLATTASGADIEAKLYTIMGKLQDANVPVRRRGWIASPRIVRYLSQIRTANGVKYFDKIDDGLLCGFPVKFTTVVPDNLGVGSNESELYFGEFDELLIADSFNLGVEFIPNAAYDNDGTVRAGASTDESVFRAISEHDHALRHSAAFAMGTGVKWGA
jgi:HK97 family phage major capsid protein